MKRYVNSDRRTAPKYSKGDFLIVDWKEYSHPAPLQITGLQPTRLLLYYKNRHGHGSKPEPPNKIDNSSHFPHLAVESC
jgi:hypothetical protein